MNNAVRMEARFRSPQNPIEWLLAICIIVVVVALAMTLMTVVIIAVAIAIVASPFVGWWRRRQVGAPTSPSESAPDDDLEGPIVDADFEIRD